MSYEEKIKTVNKRLSDFQLATVNYIERRFYEDGQNRILVADEVGLGKTWIARGIIARAYERWERKKGGKKASLNVYYICSNKQLANQNLSKVNFTDDKRCIVSQVDRIILLALESNLQDVPLRIYALTPDTSLTERSLQGIKEERAIIYGILQSEPQWTPWRKRLSELLRGYCGKESWKETRSRIPCNIIRKQVAANFIKAVSRCRVTADDCPHCFQLLGLQKPPTMSELLMRLLPVFRRASNYDVIYKEMVGRLRKLMVDTCLSLLDADLFIMDEFQRYSQLIETKGQSEQTTIAQKVFGQSKAKVLMLSATPFKAYTNRYDERMGEQHYEEFVRVLQFLYAGQQKTGVSMNINAPASIRLCCSCQRARIEVSF